MDSWIALLAWMLKEPVPCHSSHLPWGLVFLHIVSLVAILGLDLELVAILHKRGTSVDTSRNSFPPSCWATLSKSQSSYCLAWSSSKRTSRSEARRSCSGEHLRSLLPLTHQIELPCLWVPSGERCCSTARMRAGPTNEPPLMAAWAAHLLSPHIH